jgi:hypothetical protein
MMLPPELLYTVLRYPLDLYPFPRVIAEILEEPDLAALQNEGRPLATRATDQRTRWHPRFYEAGERWGPLYHSFVTEYVARLLSEPFLYQAVPSLRVQLPGNLAVGAYHRDAEYGHPAGLGQKCPGLMPQLRKLAARSTPVAKRLIADSSATQLCRSGGAARGQAGPDLTARGDQSVDVFVAVQWRRREAQALGVAQHGRVISPLCSGVTLQISPRGTEGLQTRRWRKQDSNSRSRFRVESRFSLSRSNVPWKVQR